MNDDQLFDRRHKFLVQRVAGGTYRQISAKWNTDNPTETVSEATVRKDVDRAKQEMVDGATRDALRGEHRAILLTMRQANFSPMLKGDVDAAKIVMSTLVREAEMFGLDDPKRSIVGVGTDIEFAADLVGLIKAVGYEPPSDLVFAATGDRAALEETSRDETPALIQATRIRPFDLCEDALDEPEPVAAPTPAADEPVDAVWSNL